MLRLEFEMPLDGLLAAVADAVPGAETVELDDLVPAADGRVMAFVSITCPDGTDVTNALADLSRASVWRCTPAPGASRHRATLLAEFDGTVFASVVAERAIPYRLVADGRRLRAVVAVEDWSQLRDLAATVEREYGGFDLRRTTELERPGGPLGRDDLEYGIRGKLTADQLEILRTAYEMGHFAVPQQATSTEVAEALDIGRSTFSERIRRSQNNLLRVLFSDVE